MRNIVKPMTWARGISGVLAFSLLVVLGCSTGGQNPAAPPGMDDPGISPPLVPLPASMQLAGDEHCQEKSVRPDKRTKFNVLFTSLEFPEGSVDETIVIAVCVDGAYYAVDLSPGGAEFLKPVSVSFRLDADDFMPMNLDRLAVALILPAGERKIIPHTLDVKKNWITVTFSIEHFSRYALVLD